MLAKSQLRAARSGRSGASMFRHVGILAAIDAACFVVSAVIGYEIMVAVSSLSSSQSQSVVSLVKEGLVVIPVLVPSSVLVTGIFFELSVSSRFASSDSVNWLPVTQVEYVAASTLSIAYAYSVLPSIMLGLLLWPAIAIGHGLSWAEAGALSCVSLFYGGAAIEITRAAVNKVSTTVMSKARRGVLVIRLAATITAIVAIEVIFNFVFLLDIVNRFESSLNAVAFLPVLWASLAVRASLAGDLLENVAFSASTVAFAACLLWIAVRVRARYWSPTPSQVVVTHGEYTPGSGGPLWLRFFRLDPVEAALVGKDLRGLARRRELLQYFSIPFVIGVILVLQTFLNPASGLNSGSPSTDQIVPWFVGGLFALMISSIGFGQEGRSASLLYSLPITAGEVLRAKLFVSLLLAMTATLGLFAFVTALSRPPPIEVAENLVVAIAITAEEVMIGTAFGARYPDFQERPRPRFVDPVAILMMMLAGMTILFVTAAPSLVGDAVTSLPGLGSKLQSLFLVSTAFAVAVTALAYGWAKRETVHLLGEFTG